MTDAAEAQAEMIMHGQMLPQLRSQYMMHAVQAYEQSCSASVAPEVTEMAHHFKLDERITKDLDQQLKKRNATFDEDLHALWQLLEGARHPWGLLKMKIQEMREGTFRGTATPDRDVEDLARKYGLDVQASARLAEALSHRNDRRGDIKMIARHVELSNKPSALVMLMLKDLRAGKPLTIPEHPPAVGSYSHKQGLRRRSRSRGRRSRSRGRYHSPSRSRGGPSVLRFPPSSSSGGRPRAQTLLERFG